MNVYVDELPSCCGSCGFCCKDDLGYWCQAEKLIYIADELIGKTRLQSCPLQSLADYTKRVLDIIDERFNCFGYVEENFEDIKKYVLDQIQGETNG